MAGKTHVKTATNGAGREQAIAVPPAPPALDRDALTDKELAKAVLAREFRPRVAEVRRLAEALLGKAAKKDRPKGKGKKAKSKNLAKIPRQKK